MQQENSVDSYKNHDTSGYAGEPERTKILLHDNSKDESEMDLQATVNKLRTQNEKLRGQLKELSLKLTETLERVKNKKNPDRTSVEFREETLRKELENASKQAVFYQKELEKLKFKLDTTHSADRVTKLENVLKDKDRVIEEMTVEKRNLEKIKRDQEKQLDTFRNERDFINKINMYQDEVKALKDKIREMQKFEKHEEKSFKKQQEYLVILEGKYREVCEMAGVSSSLNFSTAQDINSRNQKFKPNKPRENSSSVNLNGRDLKKIGPQTVKNGKRTTEGDDDEKDGEDEKIELTEAKFKELRNIINILKKSKETTDRKFKGENEQLMSKVRDTEFDNKQLQTQLRDKEKELKIITYKFNEIKRMSRHNQLNPLMEPVSTSKVSENNIAKVKSSGYLNSMAKPNSERRSSANGQRRNAGRRDRKGRYNSKIPEFDDIQMIDKESKISKLTFWFDSDQIYGIRACYSIQSTGADVIGQEHLMVENKEGLQCQSLEIDSDDRIAVVSGRYKNFIGFIKIATLKGVQFEFGSENGKNSAQSFLFDFETNEHPTVIYGGLDKIDNDKSSALAYLGFYINKHQGTEEIREDIRDESA